MCTLSVSGWRSARLLGLCDAMGYTLYGDFDIESENSKFLVVGCCFFTFFLLITNIYELYCTYIYSHPKKNINIVIKETSTHAYPP
jgi:hypothetical protein